MTPDLPLLSKHPRVPPVFPPNAPPVPLKALSQLSPMSPSNPTFSAGIPHNSPVLPTSSAHSSPPHPPPPPAPSPANHLSTRPLDPSPQPLATSMAPELPATPLVTPTSNAHPDPHLPETAPTRPSAALQPDAAPDQSQQLSPAQTTALHLMLTGLPDTHIALELSLDRKTLYNWRTHHPSFKAALDAARNQLFLQSQDRYRALLTAALDTLAKQVTDPYAPTSHRAARTLLSLSRLGHHIFPPPPTTRHQPRSSPPLDPPGSPQPAA